MLPIISIILLVVYYADGKPQVVVYTMDNAFTVVDKFPVLERIYCRKCERVYVPVCANDGKTYTNACRLNCHNRKRRKRFRAKLVRYGPCIMDEVTPKPKKPKAG